MFGHLYLYRVKSLLRGRVIIFWSLIYPCLLAILFSVTFGSHVGQNDNAFEPAAVAVVNEGGRLSATLLDTIKEVEYSEGHKMFYVSEIDANEAEAKLLDQEVVAVIIVGDDVKLNVRGSGLYQSITKTFTDTFIQSADLLMDTYMNAPEKAQAVEDIISGTESYIHSVTLGGAEADSDIQFFYNIIAMACLFGSFIGIQLGNELQANASPLAARKCISSAHRLKMIVADMFAAFSLDFVEIMIVTVFIRFVLGINIVAQPLPYILICLLGSLLGVAIGQFTAFLARGKEGLQIALSLSFSLLSCFLSGLMVNGIENTIQKSAPIINRVNPAYLITNSFYCLTVYTDYRRFAINLVTLAIEAVVLTTCSFFAVRRVRHESI